MPDLRAALRAAAERGVDRIAAFNRRRLARAESPFGIGVHAPMRAELTLADLPITGSIPPGLDGTYLRMGANPVDPDLSGQHWFLGDGMVQAVTLADGHASWRNRWIRSRTAAAVLGRESAPGPRRGRNDTVNTNVVAFGDRVFALVEAGSYPVEIDHTGDGQRYNPFDGTLDGGFTGHPHRDPRTGEHHAICYDGNIWNEVRHVVVSDAGRVVRDEPVAVRDGPCIHDTAFTDRFVIVLDLPVTFSMRAVLGGHVFPYRWNKRHRARVGLLPRDGRGTDIAWCDIDPCFVFHIANAFDAPDGRVAMDVVAYRTMFSTGGGGLDAVGRLERWLVDPGRRRVERRVLDDTPQEFPRIDERRAGRPHRYVTTVAAPPDRDPQLRGASTLFRHDTEAGTRVAHDFGADRIPGEFVFVPAHERAAEDEGWLLGLVIDRAADATDFVILGARDVTPVASVRIPHRIPPGFHGNWFPAK